MAVLVDLFTGTGTYDIAIVAGDGSVVARAHPKKRTPILDAAELPYVSASSSRVYYLDGDRDVRYLKADGTTGLAGFSVPGRAGVHATFAVSPDDARIAVAVLDYSVDPVQLTLYVVDAGSVHPAVIYSSTTQYVWPVAWRLGRLVVADHGAPPFVSQAVEYSNGDRARHPYGPNPYGAVSYEVIHPSTAQSEPLIVGGGGGVTGLLSRSGTGVLNAGSVDWTGTYRSFPSGAYQATDAAGSLSPSGVGLALYYSDGRLLIIDTQGFARDLRERGDSSDWVAWLDGNHLVTGFYQRSDGSPSIIDISYLPESGVVLDKATPIDAHGIVAAILPANLDG